MDTTFSTICLVAGEASKDVQQGHKTAAIQRYGQALQLIGNLLSESHLKMLIDDNEKGWHFVS
jgi:hypothetical protein